MNTVSLAPDGTLHTPQGMVGDNILRHLSSRVELQTGVTLGSVLNLCRTYPLLAELSEFLPDLLARTADACSRSTAPSPDTASASSAESTSESPSPAATETELPAGITHLEFVKTVEMIGFPGKPRMEIYTSLRGQYHKEHIEIKYFQLESLIGVPVLLGQLRHVVFGDSVDVLEFATAVTLFELIDGVTWELGFHATPQECQLVR